ncbi:Arginine/agmatine antiporter [Escherichia coli]|nr:amino acid permease [Escherichia coli]VCV64758.1 Arginine/agmatine antiporter [Escherichia coli]
MIPNAALRVSASPFGDAARMALGDTAGAIVSFCAAGLLRFTGRLDVAGGSNGEPLPMTDCSTNFARVNKAGTPVAGLIIVGILMTIFQLSISPNATKEFGLVSSVSVIFTLVPYLYTCAALLLLGHGHFARGISGVTTIAFLCIWGRGGVRSERGYVVICHPDGHHRHVCAELQPAT